jgi:thymidylate kinase
MQHRLILFTGSSPGVGKSTLSRLLFQQITANGIPARWLHEDDVVQAFELFVPELASDKLTPDLLLKASAALVEAYHAENTTFVVDSYLPGFYYLYGRYPDTEIEIFSAKLSSILSPLRPLVVYLRSDIETALTRGVRQRGAQWLENITRYLNGWQLPLYGDTLKPLRTIPDVINFFARVDQLAIALFTAWPDALILEATETPIDQLVATILTRLDIPRRGVAHGVSPEELYHFVGVYMPLEGGPTVQPLEVSLCDDELFVNSYWPAGARLVPEGAARFQLEGTNRYIEFDARPDGLSSGLVYCYGGTEHKYKKMA